MNYNRCNIRRIIYKDNITRSSSIICFNIIHTRKDHYRQSVSSDWLLAFFFDIWNEPLVSTISAENHRKTTCFPARPRFFIGAMKKKISVGQTARQSNRRGINDAAWDDGDCKKRGRNGFSREQIGFVGDARASSHRASRLSLSFAANARVAERA